MNRVDLLTTCAFILVLMLGVMWLVMQDMRKHQPKARIKARMEEAFSSHDLRTRDDRTRHTDLFTISKRDNAISRRYGPKAARLRTVAGKNGIRVVLAAGGAGALVAMLMTRFMPLPSFAIPLLIVGLPIFAGGRAYQTLVQRFRRRFLEGFPDVIDLIVRAVRAGVPVTQVIGTVSSECPEPMRREFKLMSDSLQVGLDLEEVLAVAVKRIEIADFSFFCVCLLLQRETGGQLGETLEGLAGIVRTRREIRQKTKALTGEARITTKIMAAIPAVIMLAMYAMNRTYLFILFKTLPGQKLLTFGAISLAIGLTVIGKISKLDTSR
ncbi:Flp pilus assembly protein TadB [Paraburkholderia sp. RAU2J]|uniref:type II secretion system F family protein n=1 Tax=Paraburkholderia sp. RAU2J TaxID=1938810 RepID=UPI000EB55F02|nr:type II secretion system F family protein [Paraburkholderia sp. RAU2J]RKT25691.1 Flp pilus assembly protein TadB [Paraburkholderia sp. RAU2J]